MTRRIFLDTEFTNLPWTGHSELLWVGLADEAGNGWSAVNAEVVVDETASEFTRSVVVARMPDDEPRLSCDALAAGIIEFCQQPDEFWAWCPSVEILADRFGLGEDAPSVHARYWDWDLRLLEQVVSPWPPGWPTRLCDLNDRACEFGVHPPPTDHPHHPRHDALWNRDVFHLIARIERADGLG